MMLNLDKFCCSMSLPYHVSIKQVSVQEGKNCKYVSTECLMCDW